ncbi:MAG TPA: hypothetical protein VKZ49_10320 [Polyangiaceae bacterium]|nr:hypothetical protein [Polyangiaceae bacterium]
MQRARPTRGSPRSAWRRTDRRLPAAVILASLLLGACKLGQSDQEDRPLPTEGVPLPQDQPAAAEPVRTTPRPRPEPRPIAADPGAPAPAAPAPTAAAPQKAPAAGSAEKLPDAGAVPAPTAAPADAAAPAAPGVADKAAFCLGRCQGALEGCLKPVIPADGGMPQLPDTERCRQAFESCRAACE